MLENKQKKIRRHKRVRAKIYGTASRPRLCVYMSNKHIYAQLVDDEKANTLALASDFQNKAKMASKTKIAKHKGGRSEIAFEVGKLIAKKGLEKNIQRVVFDRGGFKYHGLVKALSEGAREGGLKF